MCVQAQVWEKGQAACGLLAELVSQSQSASGSLQVSQATNQLIALSTRAERKVELLVPQRGSKRKLVEHATLNAREALGRRMAESASQRRLLEGVAQVFGLEATPERIEVYDNSHTRGKIGRAHV